MLLGVCSILQVALKGQLSATSPPMGQCLKMEAMMPLVHSSLSPVSEIYSVDRPSVRKMKSHHRDCDCDCGGLHVSCC